MKYNIQLLLKITLATVVLFMFACSTTDSDTEEEGDLILDLETLESETGFGTLQAQREDESFVSSLGEGRAIGIAYLNEVAGGEEQYPEEKIVVYLYDGDELAVLIGELGMENSATLDSGDLSDFEATVELEMEDDVVTGTAIFEGKESWSFTADLAGDTSGVYWAHGTDEDSDVSADWVVLPDERQWGCACTPPSHSNPCCHLSRF